MNDDKLEYLIKIKDRIKDLKKDARLINENPKRIKIFVEEYGRITLPEEAYPVLQKIISAHLEEQLRKLTKIYEEG